MFSTSHFPFRAVLVAACLAPWGCSGGETGTEIPGTNTGGTPSGTGGATSTGGSSTNTGGTPTTNTGGTPTTNTGGTPTTNTGGTPTTNTGGTPTTNTGGSSTNTGGTPTTNTGGSAGGGKNGTGGATGGAGGGKSGTGGKASTGGTTGTGGTTSTGGTAAGAGGAPPPLDCGGMATVIENHGPPANRINYVIVGDGYSQAELSTTLLNHVKAYMDKRFTDEIGQPYKRYRNFVNICALQVPSTPICGSSAFGCCGDDQSRLANCDNTKVNAAVKQYIPASFVVDWKAVMLNGSNWWNSGGMLMYWSGGNKDAGGAALHEGSHGFHQLADEYGDCTGAQCGSNTNFSGSKGTVYAEVNSCGDPTTTDNKWLVWKGYTAATSTGVVGTWSGSRYVGTGQYRPSANSCMNSLFGNNVNTSFNPVSREQMAVGMWRFVKPIDSTEPPAGAVTNPAILRVNVIDPAVINVDWTVDGVVKVNGGITLDTSTLAAGSHTISAKAYDNADDTLVRTKACPSSVTGVYCHSKAWANSTETVNWTVTKN